MGTLTQLCTEASRRDECFTKGFWPSAGMGYVFSSDDGGLLVIDGGDMEFYRAIAPQTVLIPCSLGGAKFIKAPETACNYNNRYMQDRALSVICACMGQVTMEF